MIIELKEIIENEVKQEMPNGDRTGPLGHGPLTGRGFGYCSNYHTLKQPHYRFVYDFEHDYIPCFGNGYRNRGRGFRWCNRNPYYRSENNQVQQLVQEDEKTYLEEIVKNLEEELKQIKNRIQELSKEQTPS